MGCRSLVPLVFRVAFAGGKIRSASESLRCLIFVERTEVFQDLIKREEELSEVRLWAIAKKPSLADNTQG